MKKIITTLFLLCILSASVFGAEVTSRRLPPELKEYISLFANGVEPFDKSKDRIARDYYRYVEGSHKNAVALFAQLEGDPTKIDTALEWLYASYYHAPVRDVRPPEADAILPVNNPKLADQMLGSLGLQEIQIFRFLADTAAVNRHEAVLQFITGSGNATRAEIEQFYRNNIRALIAAVVDEEFNKVSFLIDRTKTTGSSYGAVLTRNPQTGQCILSYEGYFNGNRQTKTLTASSLETLPSAMSRNADFIQDDINQVRAQAALIPAVVYADWKAKGLGDGLALIKEALTNFYLNQNDNTYLAIYGIRLRYRALLDTVLTRKDRDVFAEVALRSYNNLFRDHLNPELERKFDGERRYYTSDAVRVPNDPRFNIFSTPYTR